MPAIRYSGVAIALHWLGALLVFCGFGLGLFMTGLEFSPAKFRYYAWHKWIGITVFLVAAARLAWRSRPSAAAAAATMPAWQRRAARANHVLLYALMLAIPVSGWLYSSATGVSVVYLGLRAAAESRRQGQGHWRACCSAVHQTLNFTLARRWSFCTLPPRCGTSSSIATACLPRMLPARVPRAMTSASGYRSMRMLRPFVPSLAMLLLATSGAAGAGRLIDKSEIRFVSKQMGVNVEGRFRKWKAHVDFKPDDLARRAPTSRSTSAASTSRARRPKPK